MSKESDQWLEATQRIVARRQQEQIQKQAGQIAADKLRQDAQRKAEGDLQTFINGEDYQRALDLLKVTDSAIVLSTYREDSTYQEGYMLMNNNDAKGFVREENYGSALAAAFTNDTSKLRTTYAPMSVSDVVSAWVACGNQPDRLLPFIYEQLNAIAKAVE